VPLRHQSNKAAFKAKEIRKNRRNSISCNLYDKNINKQCVINITDYQRPSL